MNPASARIVQDHLAAIAPLKGDLSKAFYELLFERAPAVRALFPHDMTGQRAAFSAMMLMVVGMLQEQDSILPVLRASGARHVVYGARDEDYPLVCDTLVAALAKVSGDSWSAPIEAAWRDVLDFLSAEMIRGAAEARRRDRWIRSA